MERDRIFKEEQEHLNKVIKLINEKLVEAEKNFEAHKNFIIGFKEGQRGTQFTRQAMMSLFATEMSDLKFLSKNPYFGRMDFLQDGSEEPKQIYIGRRAIHDDTKIVSYDWRSPISCMYYDYPIGEAEYENNGIKTKGQLLRKRQITINNGQLVNVQEQDTLTDDNILLSCLSEKADSRLKSIIATIQSEQNKIIRNPLKNNYIVQGVAGSGKTTVALHRIAYLLYNDAKTLKESEFMILGPNKYFLNYISELLPDLDINSVSQSTLDQIILSKIDSKVKLESQNETLQNVLLGKVSEDTINYKSSLEYLNNIESFVKNYMSNHLKEPIIYEGIEICGAEFFNKFLDEYGISYSSYGKRLNTLVKGLIKSIKEKSSELSHDVWLKYRDEFLSLPKDSERRQEILKITDDISENLKKGCQKQIKDYFKFSNVKSLNLYTAFIENLEKFVTNKNINCEEIKKYTLEKLKTKKIGYEDLVPLLYINYLVKGIDVYDDFSHLVIDEGQDLSVSQYYALKLLFPKCIFDVFGDLNQSIYSYQGINDWEQLSKLIFNSNVELLELNKSYRTTSQISNCSNYILDELGKQNSECVARNGEEINICECDKPEINILKQIESFLDKKYKTIAIICKDAVETDLVHKKLSKLGLNIHKISEKDLTYNGGLCIMPSYLSKGLEFDAVILYDANNKKYDNESALDMKLLYVAITRALHEININYTGELTKPLKKMLGEKVLQKR